MSMDKSAIETRNLSKYFRTPISQRKIKALENLNLTIEPGEIFGFLGPNGAGKTTTIKILTGLIKPTGGEARILDLLVTESSVRKKIGYLPEHPSFYPHLTGLELLDLYGQLFGLGGGKRHKQTRRLLERVGLAKDGNLPIKGYSKGMVQRIGIAQALINNPDILILDEPMEGLDPLGRKDVRDLLLELKKEGKTIFFSTHILPDVEIICDRVGILVNGNLISVGRIGDLLKEGARTIELTVEGVEEELIPAIGAEAVGVNHLGNSIQFIFAGIDSLNHALDQVRKNNGRVLSVIPHTVTLEEHFVERVKEK